MENFNQDHSNVGVQANSPSKIPLKHLNTITNSKQKQSYMPFIFRSKRTQLNENIQNPAPGQYEYKSMFQKIDNRDELEQKYHIIMENSKRIKESMIFKSAVKRFNYTQQTDYTPISYSYRLQNVGKEMSLSKVKEKLKRKQVLSKTAANLTQHKALPSIPDNSLKYGYVLAEKGKLKKMNKTGDQLNNERQAMKSYVKKLYGQKTYRNSSPDYIIVHKESKSIAIENLKQKTTQSLDKSFLSTKSQQSPKKSPIIKKPILTSNSKCNINKIMRIFEEKDKIRKQLGPGSYDVYNQDLGHLSKPQRFQFFNSTAERFKQKIQQINPNLSKSLKHLELQRRLQEAQRTTQSQFWKSLKKGLRQKKLKKFDNQENSPPGPIGSNSNTNNLKVRLGRKNNTIRMSNKTTFERKKLTESDTNFNNKNFYYGKQKQNRLSHESFASNIVIQKNKTSLKNKKQKIEEQYKKYKTRGVSDYSIRQWQNRPLSRNQGITTVKDTNRLAQL